MRNIAFLLPLVACLSPLGRATVVYSLVAGSSIQLHYTSLGFITTTTAVPAANLDSCMFQFGSCGEVDFFPVSGSSALITITNPGHNAVNNFYFPLGTFSISPFSSNDNFNSGTLTISGSPTAAAVPEPATWTMVAVALLVCIVRRAQRRNSTA
jgi:hypothetical protein